MYTEYNSDQSYIKPDNYSEKKKNNTFFSLLWKILLVIIVLAILFLLLIKFNIISLTSSVMPEAILLNQNEIGIKVDNGYQLIATVLPENSKNKKMIWTSSNDSIVEVNEVTGYITGKKEGTAIITVKSTIADIMTDCIVNVTGKNISPTSISVNEKYISLAVGYTHSLSYRILPNNATAANLNFSSSDSSVAVVDSLGNIKGIKEGNAIITVSTNNGSVKDISYVTIYKKGTSTIVDGESKKTEDYPSSLTLNYTDLSLKSGTTSQIISTILPANANQKLSWSSTNSRVAAVDSNGLVVAKENGTATIIAKTINDITASVKITVDDFSSNLRGINITTDYAVIPSVGMGKQLVVVFNPKSATNKTVTWTSSNPDVATVNSSGYVKAISPGSAIITATSNDGGYKDTATINVGGTQNEIPVTNISYAATSYQVGVNGTINLNPIITPNNATFKAVTFSSSDTSIATVDSNGVVKGIKEGEVTITTTVQQYQLKANVKIIVNNISATSVSLNTTSKTLTVGESFTLNATVLPSNVSNKTVTFTSADTNIATVDNNGVVTAKTKGTTSITIKPNGGGNSSTCLIIVK